MIKKQLTKEILKFKTFEEFKIIENQYLGKQQVSFNCQRCGQKTTLGSFLEFKNFDTCFKCDRLETNLKKYGGSAPACNKKIQEQIKLKHLTRTPE